VNQRIFDKKNVILTRINETDLESFLVDIDVDDKGNYTWRLNDFANAIIETIPEYVFANYAGSNAPKTQSVSSLRDAVKSIYRIDDYDLQRKAYLLKDTSALTELNNRKYDKKYYNRGEFGELILHLLLREFHNTVPLISKAYFKDSMGVAAHGFDAVHISTNSTGKNILWLGESKLYTSGKNGIDALIGDIEGHFKNDYLNQQIAIIKKNLCCNDIPQRDEWIERLNNTTKLGDILSLIKIPLLCTYSHNIYNLYKDLNLKEAIDYHEIDARELKKYFNDKNKHALNGRLDIILILLPVADKDALVKLLHEKLWHMQNI
jgi:hypothetical protein